MRGHFSIEWMAQSSQQNQTQTQTQTQQAPSPRPDSTGPAACGTSTESLPGFYSRTRPEAPAQQQEEERGRGLDRFSLQHHNPHSHPVLEAGFSSGTEEETSGYESEGGRSLSPSAPTDHSAPTPPPSPPAGRRPRTAFTAEQISSLERAFKRNAYLGTQDKAELCRKLHLSDKQIRNWFQNRRMKLKRTVQDALAQACQANVASQFVHYPELQAFRPGPYPHRYHSAASQEPPAPPGSSYVHPHSLQYAAPLDPFYQYSSLPGVVPPLMGSYPPYPQYY